MTLLTYEQYKANGGTLAEAEFNSYIPTAMAKLNRLTFNRLSALTELPQNVILCLTRFVDCIYKNKDSMDRTSGEVTSYSNGIESISYADIGNNENANESLNDTLHSMAQDFLSETPELLYRGVC